MARFRRWAAAAASLVACAASAQVTSYDPATGLLTIPSVAIGTSTFADVRLLNVGNFTFVLQGASAQVPPGPGVAGYDAATAIATIPAVRVGDATYLDVGLLNVGNYVFTLQGATPLPEATLNGVKSLLASLDGLWANGVPASGSARVALQDRCYRHDGRTRDWLVADVDARPQFYQQRDAYEVGRTTTNVQVLAVRQRTNPDGSARQEVDVQYDVHYRDGTVAAAAKSTIVSGSSFGTPGCATSQDAPSMRFLGNQQLVGINVRARNERVQRYSVTTGAALSPAVQYRRGVQWQITDPMGNAAYVVVTGPGPAATVGGVATQFSLKFVSPLLLRSAPELSGKPGNYLNWLDDDNFRYCRSAAAGTPVASIADCVGQGATGTEFGVLTGAPDATRDANFEAQGWVAGGWYRFDVYADDGWKTVNGQAGRTPLATYYAQLERLPYTFVEMAGSGTGSDKFPRLSVVGLTPAQVVANAVSAAPQPKSVTWSALGTLSDGRRFGVFEGWQFNEGAKLGNPGGAFWPAYRTLLENFPGSQALNNPAWPAAPKLPNQASVVDFDYTLLLSDRNNSQVLSTLSFQ